MAAVFGVYEDPMNLEANLRVRACSSLRDSARQVEIRTLCKTLAVLPRVAKVLIEGEKAMKIRTNVKSGSAVWGS